MSQTDIWQYLKVEAPTVTRTLTRMESSGWINRRQGKDKRERIIELSSHAKQFFPTIKGKIETLDQEYLAPLSEQERLQLLHLLEKLGTKKDDLDES
ncbi:transcriptional regulator [Halalkalibacter wakoensis JCM 9140]|uniref:Transcriptional regulator n=2 Tax=Halalkalibacter wakoensis TaxID=127891 RepID=W4Q1Y9_9BACI|nr:transcriptional regulator [Halalkalibacter wakoensis JCM 9140]